MPAVYDVPKKKKERLKYYAELKMELKGDYTYCTIQPDTLESRYNAPQKLSQ